MPRIALERQARPETIAAWVVPRIHSNRVIIAANVAARNRDSGPTASRADWYPKPEVRAAERIASLRHMPLSLRHMPLRGCRNMIRETEGSARIAPETTRRDRRIHGEGIPVWRQLKGDTVLRPVYGHGWGFTKGEG